MSDSDSASVPAARVTLKLKGTARKSPPPAKPAPAAQHARTSAHKPGDWADEYKARMQADMDALAKR